MTTPRALCIWIPDWPVQRLALERPDLHRRTVVLYQASPQGGLKVVAATRALGLGDHAAGFTAGIYPGMPLAEAAALVAHVQATAGSEQSVENALRGVPAAPKAANKIAAALEPLLQPADPAADDLGLRQLAEWCQRFSPIVGVEDAPSPDCLLLDISGLGHLFGGEQALAGEVCRAFAARGLSVRVAIADTIGAAWAAAHFEPLVATPPSSGAWIPVKHQVLAAGETEAALAPLPIGYLRVAEETAALLATLGIYRVGQLAALPRWALLSRFGPDLLRRLDQSLGHAPETIVARHAAPQYAADFTFEAPLANREAIEHVLRQLIARLTEPLSRRREGALALVVRLNYERASVEDFRAAGPQQDSLDRKAGVQRATFSLTQNSFTFHVGLFRASASADYLCDLLRLRLESVRLAGPVTSVHVEVTTVGPLDLQQQSLFESEANQDQPRRLAALVDRLSNRLGRDAVVQVALLADAQPEYTCIDVPLAGGRGMPETKARPATGKKKTSKKKLTHVRRYGLLEFAADERPVALFPQPARIEIVALAPHGAPAQFRFAGSNHSVALAWGPERIETGWWRTARREQENHKTFVRRDYYRVETTTGARYWIFRQRGSPQWFLHGRFD